MKSLKLIKGIITQAQKNSLFNAPINQSEIIPSFNKITSQIRKVSETHGVTQEQIAQHQKTMEGHFSQEQDEYVKKAIKDHIAQRNNDIEIKSDTSTNYWKKPSIVAEGVAEI